MTCEKNKRKLSSTNKLLGSLLANYILHLEDLRKERSKTISLFQIWSKVVGQAISEQTSVLSYESGILLIAVKSASAMQEITLFKLHYINQFNCLSPSVKIKALQLKLEQGSFL